MLSVGVTERSKELAASRYPTPGHRPPPRNIRESRNGRGLCLLPAEGERRASLEVLARGGMATPRPSGAVLLILRALSRPGVRMQEEIPAPFRCSGDSVSSPEPRTRPVTTEKGHRSLPQPVAHSERSPAGAGAIPSRGGNVHVGGHILCICGT